MSAAVANAANPATPEKVALGRMLYYDTRLSKDRDIACNSCHKLDAYGVDNEPTSPGHKGARGERNSPTVYNAALHVAQFWDGRAADVEAQAKGPVLNPIEMAMPSEAAVEAVLDSIPGYVSAFAAAFPGEADPLNYTNMARAIGAFERNLMFFMGLSGFFNGVIQPSRDMIVRAVTPPGAFGRVFGFVTTGFNIGGVLAPPAFGYMMDTGRPSLVILGTVVLTLMAIPTVMITIAAGSHARDAAAR